jgi:rhamnosyltransferase
MRKEEVQHVFIIGAKSVGTYGGFETFISKLTEYHQNNKKLQYHIACKANGEGCADDNKMDYATRISRTEFMYHNARCFKVFVPKIGHAQAIYYDVIALKKCCKYIKAMRITHPIVYILASRIGPFIRHFASMIHKYGGTVFLNPDGHEWMRGKWSRLIQWYWRISEKMMVKYCDLIICDSKNIEKYINVSYKGKGIKKSNPRTTYIAYGAEIGKSISPEVDPDLREFFISKELGVKEYYLIVGRFVPENNFETMIREFMRSKTQKDLVIISTENDKYRDELNDRLHFSSDPRIKLVGSVYNPDLLQRIRENAFAYLHGHEVGGTNPSLLEALGSTDLNLLLKVSFNKEVADDGALYWTKSHGSLAALIDEADQMKADRIGTLNKKARARIINNYNWTSIANAYQDLFLSQKV